ncbi:response regulator [Terrabacter koreensis]
MALRVVFAEDNYLVRQGTAALLGTVEDIEVVAVAQDVDELMRSVDELRPDAVLTDVRMPPTFTNEGIDAAKRIRAAQPSVGVVVLSQYVEPDFVYELLEDGVEGLGYLLKERVSDIGELVRALREVAGGGSALDPKVVERLLQRTRAEKSVLSDLTERETEVLRAMATGRSNAAIAKTIFMSERAVEKHITSLFQKLSLSEEGDLNRRVAAVLTFIQAGGHAGSR